MKIACDKTRLGISWLKGDLLEVSNNLPEPGILAAEIVEDLQTALEQFRLLAENFGDEEKLSWEWRVGMLKTIIIFALIFIPGVLFSAQFDMWNTGMTLSEVVETARQHNVPIRRAGVFSQSTNFDKHFIDESFWKAQEVGYITSLLGQGAKVGLKIHPESPRRVYEIGIQFTGKSSSQEFKAELLNMLSEKHGQPSRVLLSIRKAYRWEPAAGDEILLTMNAFPLLTYTDVKLKEHAKKQAGFHQQNQKQGYTKNEYSKF